MYNLYRLAESANLEVVGSTYQQLDKQNVKTYIGKGKVEQIKQEALELRCDTVIFDDELSPTQGRNLENAFKRSEEEEEANRLRVCDRSALILSIFDQRA